MEIEYKNQRIKKVCNNASFAEKTYGTEMASKIHQRIDELHSAENIEMMLQYRIGRCHALKGDRKGQYAVDLVHPQRLVFNLKKENIEIAIIKEIVDYHD